MTKFARLNITVPVDDGLPIGQLAEHLHGVLEERGMEALDLVLVPNGDATLPDTPRKARVYWPAATVVRAIERPPAEPKPKVRAPRAAA